jgi:glycerate 2-kinase
VVPGLLQQTFLLIRLDRRNASESQTFPARNGEGFFIGTADLPPFHSNTQLAIDLWWSGVRAVQADETISDCLEWQADRLCIRGIERPVRFADHQQVLVVGGGKAAAWLGHALWLSFQQQAHCPWTMSGWLNVPQQSFPEQGVGPIHFHAARPPGRNEPTYEAMAGTAKIRQMLQSAPAQTLCICLLTGGGSALLVDPIPEVSLEEKLQVTQMLSRRGANIHQLNAVRMALSRVKGGGLLLQAPAQRWITLAISDVLDDHLPTLASGPTIPRPFDWRENAMAVLEAMERKEEPWPMGVAMATKKWSDSLQMPHATLPAEGAIQSDYVLLANNQMALQAAFRHADRLAIRADSLPPDRDEGDWRSVAKQLVDRWIAIHDRQENDTARCILSGGEPTVTIPPSSRGKGGRNQQLSLGVLCRLLELGRIDLLRRGTFLSAGTDGEDGPTDAAGAWIDQTTWTASQHLGLDPFDFLDRCDAYSFFDQVGTLFRTGPTRTNVCDLRIALSSTQSHPS